MTSVPIAFFQVGATAIPTLLVAVAIGAKAGKISGEIVHSGRLSYKIFALVSSIVFMSLVGAGELAALTALFRGHGNSIEAGFIWFAVTTCLFMIIMEFMAPIFNALKRSGELALGGSVMLAWIAVNIYGIYIMG